VADLQAGNPQRQAVAKEDLSKARATTARSPPSAFSDGGHVPASKRTGNFGSQNRSGHPGAQAISREWAPASSKTVVGKRACPQALEADCT